MRNYRLFTVPYFLVEDAKGKHRPFFKEYPEELPRMRLNSPRLCCPFTDLRRSNQRAKRNPAKPGYCENCITRYDNYHEHVATEEHREFAMNDHNYRGVDQFIKEYLEQELFGASEKCLGSPCEKLEDAYSSGRLVKYSSSDRDDLIRVSVDSDNDCNSVVDIDVIMGKISNETREK